MNYVDFFNETVSLSRRSPVLTDALKPYWDAYTDPDYQAEMKPIRVVCEVDGPMGGYDRLTLDGLLARMVVDEAYHGNGLDGQGVLYLLPVPLFRLWTCPDTSLPLWAAGHFDPVGPSVEVHVYWHKRMIRPEHARDGEKREPIFAIKGRYKEKRIPLPAVVARHFYADCIGHIDEVIRLLEKAAFLGKRRYARVTSWTVCEIETFRMNRPVPLAYQDAGLHGSVIYAGWTPPYWAGVPECQAPCVKPNTM